MRPSYLYNGNPFTGKMAFLYWNPETNYPLRLLVWFDSIRSEVLNCIMINTIHQTILTHWGLVTPYGDRELGQHWLR